MPCPPYPRTIPYRPAPRIDASIAAEMSVSRPRPVRSARAPAAIPAHMASSATVIIRSTFGSIWPTPTVTAASPCQPSRIAPQSMEITSPSRSTWVDAGIACTICSLTLEQIVAGKPWYPLNDGTAPASRTTDSASASRSAVLTPGATASRSRPSADATTRPASRILVNCSGVLYSMSRLGVRTLTTVRAQRVDATNCDVLDRPGRVDAHQLALRAVVVDQRRGLVRVLAQPLGDDIGLVVVALVQLAAAAVADLDVGGRLELDVPDLAAAPALPPAGQPPDHLVVVDHQLHHEIELGTEVGQQLVQRDRLRHRAREAVEQETVAGIGLGQPVADHVDGHLVRYQLAVVHEALGFQAQRRALRHVGPEDVPGRDLGHGEVRGDELGLGPLTRSRGTHEHQPPYLRNPSQF